MEDGSKAGFLFGSAGGFVNLVIMVVFIVKIISISVASVYNSSWADYLTYGIFVFLMLYMGVMGVLLLVSAYKMKYSYSLPAGARLCILFGVLSVNVFAIFGGVFGLTDIKAKALAVKQAEAEREEELQLNSGF